MSGPAEPLSQGSGAADPAAEVDVALAGLDEADLATHADAFEAASATISRKINPVPQAHSNLERRMSP